MTISRFPEEARGVSAITGGTINGTTIGATTPAAITGTTLGIDTSGTNAQIAPNTSIAGWNYSGLSKSINAEESAPAGLFLSPDGLNMYVNGSTGDDVNQYTLSTAFNISTATFVRLFSTAAQDSAPNDIFFKPDGLSMFIMGQTNDTVFQYTLSSAFDISTASYASLSFSVTSQESTPTGLWFKPDGTVMYVIGSTADTVFQYTLGTAWNVSTASYASISFSVATQESAPVQVNLSADGTKMWITGSTGDDISQYALGTAFNVSTAVFENSFYIGFQETTPTGLFIDSSANNRVYLVGSTNDTVYQYNTDTNSIAITTDVLTVNNNARIQGNLAVQSSAYVDGSSTIQGALVVGGSTSLSTTSVGGTFTASSTLALTAGTTSTVQLGTSVTTGNIFIGGATQTGNITFGYSSVNQTANIANGTTAAGSTKVVNLGTSAGSGSNTQINIGPSTAGANGNVTFNPATTVAIQNTKTSTSTTTGALTVLGGVGVSGNVYADAIYDGGVEVLSYLQGVDNTQNTRLTVIEGTNLSQNVRLDFSNTRMNIIDGVDVSQNARMTISDGVNASQNVRLDYSNTAITIIQGVDAGQNARMAIIEGTDASQNVRLNFSNTRMDISDGVNASQNVRLDFSNTRMNIIDGVDAGQNSRMIIIEGTDTSQNARMTIADGVDASQNVRLDYSNTAITIIQGVDAGQNARMTIADGVDASQNSRLDYSNTALTIAQGVDNSQNVRIDYSNAAITIIQGTDTTQNTRLTVIEGTNASQNVRIDFSNTAITIIQGVDVTQNTRLTVSEGVDLSQNVRLDFSNTRMNIIDGVDAGQNARMTIIEGVDVTQNTSISNRLALSGAASQTVTGNVVFGNDVTVTGNLVVLGNTISLNVTSIEVEDTLIQLGIGNYYTDALTIGYVGHYNDGTNAHAGMIRDAVTKEFYAFQGYTPEASGNVINVNAASFAKANIHGNWFKGNLIATTARVGGLDVNSRLDFSNTRMTIIEGVDVTQNTNIAATDGKMQSAYNVANTADVRSVAAYFHANGAFIKANAAFDQANVTIGVDASQNSRMTIIEGTDLSQNVRLDYSNTALTIAQCVDNSQNVRIDYSNAAITIIQGVDTSQNARMVIIEGTDTSQNARMTIADGVNASQNVRLDYSNTAITIIQGTDTSQNVRIDYSNTAITIIQGVDTTQNSRMTIIEGTDVSQNARMVIIEGTDVSQNARMTISDGVNASQNVRLDYSNTALTIAQGVDDSQNVRLNYSNTVINQIQSAWTPNTVIVANSAGFLSNSVMRFDASNSQLHSMANLSIGTSVASAPLTLSKSFLLPTAAEQFGQLNSVAYNVADTSLKQGLRLNTVAQHTSGNITNLMSMLNLCTAGGVGGTTDSQYGFWARNDVSAGAFSTNSYNYFSNNSGGLAGPSNQYGFYTANLTKGLLSNYGFYGAVNTGNNAFNLYMAGTAPNYLAGSLTVANNVPSTSNTTGTLIVTGGIGVSGNVYSTGGSITINNGFATTGNSGTIFLGDSSFNKTFGSGFTFNSSINAQQFVANPGSNSAAAFTFSGVGNLGIYAPLTGVLGITANSANALFVSAPASSVNYLNVSGAITSNYPTIQAIGPDSSVGIVYNSKNAGIHYFQGAGGTQFTVLPVFNGSASVNYVQASGNSAGNPPTLTSAGSDTNIDFNIISKGTGVVNLNTGSGTQVRIIDSGGTAVNRIHLQGQATGFLPVIASRGSDTNLGMSYSTQGTGGHDFYTATTSFTQQFKIAHTASAVNLLQVTGNTTGGSPILSGQGSDTNVGININPKGAGSVNVTSTTSSTSNTTGALVVTGGLGLSGNLTMSIVPNVGRLTLSPTHFIYNDSAGIVFTGTNYYYFNNTGGVYNQTALIQRGPIYNDTGNTTVLFAGTSQVKIQNGTASSNTTTGALVVQGGVGISGALNATTKSFNIPHPTKEGKDLRYGSLEGPEFGVYVRGTLKGSNIIELPDYWTKLVDANTITVSLTSIGKYQKLSVKEVKDNTIIISSDGWFKKEIHCYYVVYGERADVDKLDVEG